MRTLGTSSLVQQLLVVRLGGLEALHRLAEQLLVLLVGPANTGTNHRYVT